MYTYFLASPTHISVLDVLLCPPDGQHWFDLEEQLPPAELPQLQPGEDVLLDH